MDKYVLLRCLLLFPILILPVALHAQMSAPDTLLPASTPVSINMGFERNVNTYLWDMGAKVHHKTPLWTVSASEQFLRTLIRTNQNNIKDNQNFQLDIGRQIGHGLELATSFGSFLFSDQRSVGLHNISTHKPLIGVNWLASDHVVFSPFAGYSFDQQQGILDQGFMYRATALLRDLRFGDYSASADLYSTTEYINPRQQQEHRGQGILTAQFSDKALNRTILVMRSIKRDFYLAYDSLLQSHAGTANQIESRNEIQFSLINQLEYRISQPLSLYAAIDLNQRDIERSQRYRQPPGLPPVFDSDITEFRLNGSALLSYDNRSGTWGTLRAEAGERSEVHSANPYEGANPIDYLIQQQLQERKNNNILQTHLSFSLSHAPTLLDTVSLSASTVRMRYDTPSDNNFDDRDELFIFSRLRWSHRFSPTFLLSLIGDVNLRHIVFIYAQRSANNTWNRVFRFAPQAEFRLSRSFVTSNGGEALANYTVYDFETPGLGRQSYPMRQLTLYDSTAVRLLGDFWGEMQLHFRFYERGELFWTDFEVRPLQYFDERTYSFSFFRQTDVLLVAVGFRMFQQARFRYVKEIKMKDDVLRSYGPTARLKLRLSNESWVIADGWYQITTYRDTEARVTPNLLLNLVWNL